MVLVMRTHNWPRVVSDIVSGVHILDQSRHLYKCALLLYPPPPPLLLFPINAEVSCGGTQSKAGIRILGTRTFRMPSFNFQDDVSCVGLSGDS